MHHLKLALLASAWLAWPISAFSQTVVGGTTPPQLLQPGETAQDRGVIHLHMPTKESAMPAKESSAAQILGSGPDQTAPALPNPVKKTPVEPKLTEQTQPKPAPAPVKETKAAPTIQPKPVKQAKAEARPAVANPPANNQPSYNPFGYGQGAAGLNFGAPAPAPAPPPPQKQMAKANPAPASAVPAPAGEAATPGFTKRSMILFAPQAADPAQSAMGAIKFLAGDLSTAMTSASARVQIQAFGGNRGDKSSDARRLSLKRALAIRQVLIDDGVPAERIDVRAMGGADDSGPADRVDVYLRT